MRVMLIAGARPNFMKVAPVLKVLDERGLDRVLVHTGQHYDYAMSESFFDDLEIPDPDAYLGVGSSSHADQTARIMIAFEPVLLEYQPDWVVVVGDVNSTLACSLVAVKVKEETGSRIAHVEAGLRGRNWNMPEEINRILTDRLSDLLFTPSRDAHPNLIAEGIPEDRIRFVGNVMIDTLLNQLPKARETDMPGRLGLERSRYAAVTLHRPSNVDTAESLTRVLEALGAIAREAPVVLPLHPRTKKNIEAFGLDSLLEPLMIIEPVGYSEMISLMEGAAAVLTDSGGIQEETTVLGIPCVTMREQTERPITITEGTNRMAPWPITSDALVESWQEALADRREDDGRRPEGWDGRASERIVEELKTLVR